MSSYKKFLQVGLALDPVHVGTGGTRIGRVDLTIVRDPVTQVPKIPGSSLAGVYRAYVAMAEHERNPNRQIDGKDWPIYPNCAGLGQPQEDRTRSRDEKKYRRGHCGKPDCPVCTVFGFARGAGQDGGFAGLAAFTDAHLLLFPVATRQGPMWVTAPQALRFIGLTVQGVEKNAVYLEANSDNPLNLGWLLLPVRICDQMENIKSQFASLGIPDYIQNRLALVPDRLFAHIINSNLEVRTSVSINPETGAAEEGALFSYEALPRSTVLVWEIIAKNPAHFRINGQPITAVSSPDDVYNKAKQAHEYLKHLGIGGMGTRGMGRVKVVHKNEQPNPQNINCAESAQEQPNPSEASEPNEEANNE